MTVITVHKAKTNLSKLIAEVLAGGEVVIARGKEPAVKLVRANPRKSQSVFQAALPAKSISTTASSNLRLRTSSTFRTVKTDLAAVAQHTCVDLVAQ